MRAVPAPLLPFLLSLWLVGPAVAETAGAAPATTRVAVLLPFVADALTSGGADVDLVANVRRSLHQPLRGDVIDLGNPHSPSFERLAEARPDVVVGDRVIHAMLVEKLSLDGRAQVMLIDTAGVDATLESLRAVGAKVGAGEAVGQQVDAVETALERARIQDAPSVLALFGTPGGFYAVSERHWLGDLVARLGYRNVAAGLSDSPRFPGLVALNDETLAGLRPELVLLISHGDPERIRASLDERIATGGVWQQLGDSATRGVHALRPDLFASNPGLQLAEAAEVLAAFATPPAVSTGP